MEYNFVVPDETTEANWRKFRDLQVWETFDQPLWKAIANETGARNAQIYVVQVGLVERLPQDIFFKCDQYSVVGVTRVQDYVQELGQMEAKYLLEFDLFEPTEHSATEKSTKKLPQRLIKKSVQFFRKLFKN